MKKRLQQKSSSSESQARPDVTELILKMQHQIVFLEKKIDTLLSQSLQRPVEARPHSKPFQRFERPHGRNEARFEHDRGERTMHQAVCADCNNECEVPFQPSQGRPVYCKECFSKRKGSLPQGGAAGKVRNSFRPHHDDRPRDREFAPAHPFNKFMGSQRRKPSEKKRELHPKRKRG